MPTLPPPHETAGARAQGAASNRVVRYGEPLEVQSLRCGKMVGVSADGVLRVAHPRLPPLQLRRRWPRLW